MAGELGFEPRSPVLETGSLTVELTPLYFKESLLGLLVIRVLAARVAKLGELETSSRGLLVLGGRVVPVLAHRTLQADDLAHTLLLTWPATSAGKQLVLGCWLFHKPAHDTPRRRDIGPCCLDS